MMPASNQGVGMNAGFPDVCMTPAAPSPVPIPYPNMGMNATAMPFCANVFMSFIPGQNMGSKPLMTNGDNAGVVHPLVMGAGGTTMGNPKILLTGLPADHLLVPTNGNNFNNPVGVKAVPSVTNVLLCSLSATAPLAGRTHWTETALETTSRELHDLPAPSLGLTTTPSEDGLQVVHVRRDGPAARAGVQPGDLLAAIDGQATAGWGELPRLVPGREVALELDREGASLSLSACWEATPPALEARLAAPGLGHLVVRRFSLALAEVVDAEIERLVDLGARTFVLDLRGNPGGALQAALATASLFLPPTTPLVRLLAPGRPARLLHAAGSGRWKGLPLVVLIDGQTASAGEVLAAALQDASRAPLVGATSFGKGVVETPAGAWAVLTRADGRELREVGVQPDHESSQAEAFAEALALAQGLRSVQGE